MARRRKYPPKQKIGLGLANILKKHRKDLGYTQAEVTRILGWQDNYTYYPQVEAGYVLPGTDARRLALGRYLGWIKSNDDIAGRCKVREWFAGDGPKTTPAMLEVEQRRKRVAHVFKKRK